MAGECTGNSDRFNLLDVSERGNEKANDHVPMVRRNVRLSIAVAAVAAVASMAVSVTTVGDSVAVAMARVSVTFGVAKAMACARLASV